MLGYITLGTNDLPSATAFYDASLAEIHAQRARAATRFTPGTFVILMATSFVYFI